MTWVAHRRQTPYGTHPAHLLEFYHPALNISFSIWTRHRGGVIARHRMFVSVGILRISGLHNRLVVKVVILVLRQQENVLVAHGKAVLATGGALCWTCLLSRRFVKTSHH